MTDIQFLHGKRIERCTARVDKWYEGYYSFQMIAKGSMYFGLDGVEQEVSAGSVFFCYPGPQITMRACGVDWEHWYIAFRGDIADSWFAEGLMEKTPFKIKDMQVIKDSLLRVYQLMPSVEVYSVRKAKCFLELMLYELQSQTVQNIRSPEWVTAVLAYLKAHPFMKMDYEFLAQEHNQSYSNFRKNFRKFIGLSIHQYHILLRIEGSKELLSNFNLSIEQIAEKAHFADVFSFSKQFKKVVGVTPSYFRRSCLK